MLSFKIKTTLPGRGYACLKISLRAQRFIICKILRINETIIDQYLKQEYQIGIKKACLKILKAMRFTKSEDSVIGTLYSEKLEKLARIITYGNGQFMGCNILLEALGKRG